MVNKKNKIKKNCFILLARERTSSDQNQSNHFLFGIIESEWKNRMNDTDSYKHRGVG